MRKFVLLGSLFTLVIVFSAQAVPPNRPRPRIKKVEVVNLPVTQEVSGSVEVTNLPPVQDVFVTNPPSCEGGGVAPRFQLVGYTQAKYQGGTTLFGFNRACRAEFSESRFCSSVEILESGDTDAAVGLANGPAWTRPVFVTHRTDASGGSFFSGVNYVEAAILNCYRWTSSTSGRFNFGLTFDENGSSAVLSCDSTLAVACCALRP